MEIRETLIRMFDGDFKTYHENGVIKEIGRFENGLLTGSYLKYDQEGYLLENSDYYMGDIDGSKKIYIDGELVKETSYSHGEAHETISYSHEEANERFLYKSDGHKGRWTSRREEYRSSAPCYFADYMTFYKNGKLKEEYCEGVQSQFWRNGMIKSKKIYIDKKLSYSEENYTNGNLKERINYINGEIKGTYESYFISGRIHEIRSYGQYKIYYQSGQLAEEGEILEGGKYNFEESKGYHENGNISSRYTKKYRHVMEEQKIVPLDKSYIPEQKRDIIKEWTSYNQEGKKTNTSFFLNDEWCLERYFGSDGGHLYDEEIFILKDDAFKKLLHYIKKPKKISEDIIEGTHLNENNDGEFCKFYKNGNLKVKGKYINGLLSGPFFYFYKNGNIRLQTNYLKGELNGYEISYYKNGSKKNVSNVIDGVKQIDSYSINGKLSSRKKIYNEEYSIDEDYFYNGNLASRSYDSFINNWHGNFLVEEYYENGLLKEKSGLQSKREIDLQKKEADDEYEEQKAIDEYYEGNWRGGAYGDSVTDGNNKYCPRCMESPCMCSDPF